MRVACLGDVMLDVIVEVPGGLVHDDDVPARISFAAGGQAANVAAWVVQLGGTATLFGPGSTTGPGAIAQHELASRGVVISGSDRGTIGTVLSVIDGHGRSLASDASSLDYLGQVYAGSWMDDADWLYVSGYALLRSPDPPRIVETAAVARAMGTHVAVDLASAAMINRFGSTAFTNLWNGLRPTVVFGTDAEWAACDTVTTEDGLTDRVLKHGAQGATFVVAGATHRRAAVAGPIVDVTGAGDALAAGYLLGGPDLAMQAASQCVGVVGAQPPLDVAHLDG